MGVQLRTELSAPKRGGGAASRETLHICNYCGAYCVDGGRIDHGRKCETRGAQPRNAGSAVTPRTVLRKDDARSVGLAPRPDSGTQQRRLEGLAKRASRPKSVVVVGRRWWNGGGWTKTATILADGVEIASVGPTDSQASCGAIAGAWLVDNGYMPPAERRGIPRRWEADAKKAGFVLTVDEAVVARKRDL